MRPGQTGQPPAVSQEEVRVGWTDAEIQELLDRGWLKPLDEIGQ